ncbi:uncharacterized protein LY89DRAFT_739839 [Mollisia scopiformis]|uniref:Rhodopsin domain-containing protein n=1 Tax=Mollisia scopiformis TaxID=149040 RepID=A0A194WSA8_MOLSC|nr:uncharacterized protein LY89DRAFT_739839 [Mollisia scopiformis]KUJ10853.1 hypothetical protein LY89DRAFT_739839 [Mollisia scopiformis]
MSSNASPLAPDLNLIPAVPAPPGVSFNPDDLDNYKHRHIVMHSVGLSIVTIAVLIRLYTRAFVKKFVGLDDYLLILSWMASITFSTILAYSTRYGFGMHTYDIPASKFLITFKWLTISQWCYFPAVLSVKVCILLTYLRIFQINRTAKWMICFGIAAMIIFYIVAFFCTLFYCVPVQRAWDRTVPGHCISYSAWPYATGIFNFCSDFFILLIPLRPIFTLTMPFWRKVRILCIFSMGLFTCVASIMRFVVTLQSINNPDQTYVAAKVLYWAIIEINLGIICTCAIVFPAFFDTSEPNSFGSLFGSLLSSRLSSKSELSQPEIKV